MTTDLPHWVDFHCHLDLYPDHVSLIEQCEKERIATLAVTTTPKAWDRNRQLAQRKYVTVGLGLHPQLVAERAHELALWKSLLHETRYVGEVGLDAGPKFYASFAQQKNVFRAILKSCAAAGNKILSVHSVRCAPIILAMLAEHLPRDRGRVVLHWFTGTKADARRAQAMGCYFSVNADMLRSERGRELILNLPSDRIVTETDGPFGQVEGRPARPSDVPALIAQLAKLRCVEPHELKNVVVSNWKMLDSQQ